MVRVDIETIVMAAGPVPSLIVLRERCSKSGFPPPRPPLHPGGGVFELRHQPRHRQRTRPIARLP